MARNYSSVATLTTLSAGVTALDTVLQVLSTAGYPVSTPFTLVLDPGKIEEEAVEVTAVSGLTLTVVRGIDGTSATSHSAGAEVRHMATARDFREPQQHIDATVAHGAQGAVVGTTNTQTLTNKTLQNPTLSGTMSGGTVNANSLQQAGVPVVTPSATQALTNKDLSSATNTFPSSLTTDVELAAHAAQSTGVHGVSGSVVGTSSAQTLTNKTISGSSNTFSNVPFSAITGMTDQTATGSGVFTAASGWRLNSARMRRYGKVVTGTIEVERTGDVVVPNSNGNVSPDLLVGTLSSSWRPDAPGWFGQAVGSVAGGSTIVDANGRWTLCDLGNPNGRVNTGDLLRISVTWTD